MNHVYLRASRHSSYSGYDPVVRYLGRTVPGPALKRWPSGRLPRFANILSAMISRSPWYAFAASRLELAAALDMLSRKNEVYHILYGDNDLRFPLLLNGFRGHRVIATYHQPPSEMKKGVRSSTVRRLSAALAVASNQVDYLAHLVGPDCVFGVPHGVDTAYSRPTDEPKADPPTVLSVGAHLRDFVTLIRAAEIVRERAPQVRFVVVAQAVFADLFSASPNITHRHGVSDEDLLQLYREATLAVFSLRDATANIALLEAIACGLPIVVTDVGGVRDYVNDTSARLIPPADADALSGNILELLDDSRERARLSVAARQHVRQFDFAEVAKSMRAAYARIP